MDPLAALALQLEWGADEALEGAPLDRLAAKAAHRPPVITASGAEPPPDFSRKPMRREAGEPAISAAARSDMLAASCESLDALRSTLEAFDLISLPVTAGHLVYPSALWPDGARPRVVLVTDAPNEDEDRSGIPLDGAGGALLDRMLGSAGLSRATMTAVPFVPWRPPGARPPTAAEQAACLPFLRRFLALASPDRVVLLGPMATAALLPRMARRAAGSWQEIFTSGDARPLPAIALPVLRRVQETGAGRRAAWAALRRLRRAIDTDLAEL